MAAACAPVGPGSAASPTVGGCAVFPADNAWNADISHAPVRADSAKYIANIDSSGNAMVHPDFGGGGAYGIPFTVVNANEPLRRINYTAYGDESDPGPFPVPPSAPV